MAIDAHPIPACLKWTGFAGAAALLAFLCWRVGSEPSLETIQGDAGWTGSAQQVLFLREMPPHGQALYSIRLDGRGERRILEAPVGEFLLPAGGRKVAYSRPFSAASRPWRVKAAPEAGGRAASGPGECGVLDVETLERVVIATRCWGMKWDPSARYVAYEPGDDHTYLFDTVTRKSQKAEPTAAPGGQHSTELCGLPAKHGPPRDGVRSPSGKWLLRTRDGSLVLAGAGGGPERTILRNTGGFAPELGEMGFEHPSWSADERFAVGEYRGKLIVVEIGTSRAGVLARGRRPAAAALDVSLRQPVRAEQPTGGTAQLRAMP
jgi:hypothetical protein